MENGEFIVAADSLARWEWASQDDNYKRLFLELVRNGVLAQQDPSETASDGRRFRVFRQDYAFSSPSAASAVVHGRPSNGRRAWKVEGQENKEYGDWENEQLHKQ